ncbi:unnamed protein product [Ilex paraguariensis]|uniref:GDSL esterase/lipase n=1 Tax=Ilex paraguariensis TaxID=185542 RepID=A0ABC8UH27_9AQUA
MGLSGSVLGFILVVAVSFFCVAHGDPLVPALCIFGDSVVDVGNNNNLQTLIKANFLPYGRDFVTHRPTGRFCNGKLATDFAAEYLGFASYPPAYLSQDAKGKILLTGANFASASSGFYNKTAKLYGAITLAQQVEYYKEWQNKVVEMVGKARANAIFSGSIHLLSAGSSDFVQNYYINPLLNIFYSPDRFSDILVQSYSTFVQNLYGLGVRKIGVTTLPPTGCLPAAITLFGSGSNRCVVRLNGDAISFNNKLNSTSQDLQSRHPGFFESRKGCCGTGTLETSVLCNERSIGTCSNATGYVFWDGFHPSESANQILAQDLLEKGVSLIS